MLFKKIVLTNYRVFYGRQEIKLKSAIDINRNLTLIGGLNGAGKTSLLNAFNLLLFSGDLSSTEEKRSLLGSALNNKYFAEGGRKAILELYVEDRKPFTIRLDLFFDNNQFFTHHERYIYSEGKRTPLTDVEFKRFIEKKIPTEVAPFFIFDGEKIQSLVEKQERGDLKKAIQNIISLDFFHSTLKHTKEARRYFMEKASRYVSHEAVNRTKRELEECENKVNEYKRRINEYDQKIKNYEIEREAVRKIRQDKLKVSAGSKEKIVREIERKTRGLQDTVNELKKLKENIPLFLLSPYIDSLKNRVLSEQKKINALRQQKLNFKSYEDFMNELLISFSTILSEEIKEKLYEEGKTVWARINKLNLEQIPDIEIIHDMTNKETAEILKYKVSDASKIKELLDAKYKYEEELAELKEKEKEAPDAMDTSHEDVKIDQLSTIIGSIELKKRSAATKLKRESDELKRLNRKYRDLLEQSSKSTDVMTELKYSEKIVSLMELFIERVTKYKAQQISNEFSKIINLIFRKQNDFNKIEFDPDKYIIRIFNENNNPVKLSDRSAGEKQLIALSLIWALTKCANIHIPFVIDTPLGRLDSVHRENLAKHYFPHLSEQVIILSTDTEVNDQYLQPLARKVYKQYRLEYNKEKRYTTISEGYFV